MFLVVFYHSKLVWFEINSVWFGNYYLSNSYARGYKKEAEKRPAPFLFNAWGFYFLVFLVFTSFRYFLSEILRFTIWLADTVSMEHANEIFSNGKYRIENESIAWTVGEFTLWTSEMFSQENIKWMRYYLRYRNHRCFRSVFNCGECTLYTNEMFS